MSEIENELKSLIDSDDWVEADSAEELATRLANDVCASLQGALQVRDGASLVVSGGSTPLPFFKQLSNCSLAWDQVRIGLADERWVALDSADSNERMVRQNLLTGEASSAAFYGLYFGDGTVSESISDCEKSLASLRGGPDEPLDLVILGMGNDGHTASLFPHTEGLAQALELANPAGCQAMAPPDTGQPRVTLTLQALLCTRRIILHITGDAKKRVLADALATDDPMQTPIAAVFRHAKPQVYWSP